MSNSNITDTLFCNPNGARRLDPGFQPGKFDVICARGKIALESEGNRRFRALVQHYQEDYGKCTCKHQKSKVVTHIVNTVRNASPDGGFVKIIDGEYWEVGDRAAKEKVGQTFRDLLHTKYSSSTKAKARVRQERRDRESPSMALPMTTLDRGISIVSEDSFSNQDNESFLYSSPPPKTLDASCFQAEPIDTIMALRSNICAIDSTSFNRSSSLLNLREIQRDALLRSSIRTIEESQQVLQNMLRSSVCSFPTVNSNNNVPLRNMEIGFAGNDMGLDSNDFCLDFMSV